jgi:transposase
MNFEQIKIFGTFISKDYSVDLLNLLLDYKSISSSEAASRIGLHIKTVQEFFEGMTEAGILEKEEVFEKKRPYFRYALKSRKFVFEFDFSTLQLDRKKNTSLSEMKIKEKRNSGLTFTAARDGDYLSSCSVMLGKGRDRKEKKINLTKSQGAFLYKLPFPDADPVKVNILIEEAGISKEYEQEIMNIVEYLNDLNAIELL